MNGLGTGAHLQQLRANAREQGIALLWCEQSARLQRPLKVLPSRKWVSVDRNQEEMRVAYIMKLLEALVVGLLGVEELLLEHHRPFLRCEDLAGRKW